MKNQNKNTMRFLQPENTEYSRDTEHERQPDQDHQEPDMIDHPPHYTRGEIECIDAIKAATAGLTGFEAYLTGNAIKYIWRWKHKNGVQDIDKMIWYANRLKNEIGGDQEWRPF